MDWRVQLLFDQSISAFISLLLIPPLFGYLLSPVVSHARIAVWLSALLILTLCRIVHAAAYFRAVRRKAMTGPLRWEKQYGFGVLLSGLLWGAATWWLFPSTSFMHQAFMAFVVAGMASGAVSAYSPSVPIVASFLFSYILPFALRMAIEGTQVHLLTAAMALVFLLLTLRTAIRLNYHLRENARMREEQAVFLQRLTLMNHELETSISNLHRSQVEMLHASRLAAVGEMSAGIAHEINNPLAIIEGIASRLIDLSERQELTPVVLTQNLGRIHQTVERISKVIRGLLVFSARSRQQEAVPTPVDKILTQTLDLCRQRFAMNGIALEVPTPEGSLLVDCLSVQISQVLLNLLNNAFDATVDLTERWVKLSVSDRGDEVEFAVIDSGTLSPSSQPGEWFHPFYTTKEVGHGTGLGLSVSKGIVEQHGGRIWVDAHSTHTKVLFTLPKARAAKAA